MFLPIHDHNRLEHISFHYATVAIITLTVVVFVVFQSGLLFTPGNALVYGVGVIPAVVMETRTLPDEAVFFANEFSLVSYAFFHGGWFHLLSNMLFVWVFGDNVEDAVGHIKFFLFYLCCAAGGAVAHIVADPGSEIPLVGASGSVAGIVAAYLILHPRVRVWCLVLNRIPVPVPAWVVLGFWVGLQIFNVVVVDPTSNVGWWAHIGGIVTGGILILFLRRRGVPLFDRDLSSP